MTKLLEHAIKMLRELPESMQDSAARAVIRQLEEEPEPGDLDAVAAGWDDYRAGRFVTLDELMRDLGSD